MFPVETLRRKMVQSFYCQNYNLYFRRKSERVGSFKVFAIKWLDVGFRALESLFFLDHIAILGCCYAFLEVALKFSGIQKYRSQESHLQIGEKAWPRVKFRLRQSNHLFSAQTSCLWSFVYAVCWTFEGRWTTVFTESWKPSRWLEIFDLLIKISKLWSYLLISLGIGNATKRLLDLQFLFWPTIAKPLNNTRSAFSM